MNKRNVILTTSYISPCGPILLGSLDNKLALCDWGRNEVRPLIKRRLCSLLNAEFSRGTSSILDKAKIQLDEYFSGKRQQFDIPLHVVGTEFQKKVWNKLLFIPYGETVSYGTLAQEMEMPKAARAVANANRSNALSIFIPCHRVIGSNCSLTGYAGGLAAKKYLLTLEKAI